MTAFSRQRVDCLLHGLADDGYRLLIGQAAEIDNNRVAVGQAGPGYDLDIVSAPGRPGEEEPLDVRVERYFCLAGSGIERNTSSGIKAADTNHEADKGEEHGALL